MASPGPTRRRPVSFRPRFTLMIVYFALCFVGVSLLMVLPDLVGVLREAEAEPGVAQPSPEAMQAQASEVARRAMQGKVFPAFVLAVLVTGVLTWYGRLPGMRAPH